MYNESKGNINIGSDPTGYTQGVGQVSKDVWDKYSKISYNLAGNPKYYQENLNVSAHYLKDLTHQFGNYTLGLMAYNMGPGNLTKYLLGKRHLPKITEKYVQGFKE